MPKRNANSRSNRNANPSPKTKPLSERWYKRVPRRRWMAAGMLAVAITGTAYWYHLRRVPQGIVATFNHQTHEGGVRLARDFKSTLQRERIGVLAIEKKSSTQSENIASMQTLESFRVQFEKWRRENNPDEETARATAILNLSQRISTDEDSHAIFPVLVEALLHRIPIEIVETVTPERAKQLNQMNARYIELNQRAVEAPTLADGVVIMKEKNIIHDAYMRERNNDIVSGIESISKKYRKKGKVYTVVGASHFEVGEQTGSRVRPIEMDDSLLTTSQESMRKLDPETRAERELICDIVNAAGNLPGSQRRNLIPAFHRAQRINRSEFQELDRKFGQLPPVERVNRIVETLLQWANVGK